MNRDDGLGWNEKNEMKTEKMKNNFFKLIIWDHTSQ